MGAEDFAEESSARRGSGNRVRFYRRPKPDAAATLAEGRPIVKMVEYVTISSGNDLRNIVDRPARDTDRQNYPRQHAAFLNDKSQDEAAGTLLSAAGIVTPERVEELKYFKIYTVENYAAVGDGQLNQMGLHSRKEREDCKAYIATAKGFAPVAQLRAEIEEMREREAAKDARMLELERRFAAMPEPKEAPEATQPKKKSKEQ